MLSPVLVFAIVALIIVILILMRPHRFYFVRHGGDCVERRAHSPSEGGGLSEKGRQQAERVGEALKKLPIQHIISSTYQRARETTDIINTYLKVSVTYSRLLVERRNPKELIGLPAASPEAVHIVDEMDLTYHDDDFRISDEENFLDLRTRARKCLELLALQGGSETVVVTHHHFLKMLIAYLLYGESLHAKDFVKLSFFNYADNAGITVCEYRPWRMFSATHGWEVITYNEQP